MGGIEEDEKSTQRVAFPFGGGAELGLAATKVRSTIGKKPTPMCSRWRWVTDDWTLIESKKRRPTWWPAAFFVSRTKAG
jgi:hypothetical protein